MSKLLTEAFASFGATLRNKKWSMSAFGADGCLVLAVWQNWIKRGDKPGTMVYRDTLSLWKGNALGRTELANNLTAAVDGDAIIRLVIVQPMTQEDAALVGNVPDESVINKAFLPRPDAKGRIEYFDGDNFLIAFGR